MTRLSRLALISFGLPALASSWALPNASAAPISTLDAEDFSYVWNFDDATTAENYDRYNNTTGALGGDGTNEWTTTPAPVSGVVSVNNTLLNNSFWALAAAGTSQITATTGFTAEYRVRMAPNATGTAAGDKNGLTLEATLPGSTAAFTVQYKDFATTPDTTTLDLDYGLSTSNPLKATVPASEFFVVRFVATPDVTKTGGLAYTLYVNGVLVDDNANAAVTSTATRRFYVGDIGSGSRGLTEIDYVAFTPGAFAPVPEPGSLALAGLASLCVLARRRRA